MFKKDFDNVLQEVLHAAMISMQLATIGDMDMRRDWELWETEVA
jgi:hypothetical protein